MALNSCTQDAKKLERLLVEAARDGDCSGMNKEQMGLEGIELKLNPGRRQ